MGLHDVSTTVTGTVLDVVRMEAYDKVVIEGGSAHGPRACA